MPPKRKPTTKPPPAVAAAAAAAQAAKKPASAPASTKAAAASGNASAAASAAVHVQNSAAASHKALAPTGANATSAPVNARAVATGAAGAVAAAATVVKRGPQLASKEAGLFKQVLKLYEMKQYKKGLKTAEQILKKSPDHGESRAMHGLLMFQMDQKEEGYKEIEKGVELDPGSHIVWHVYGLAYRSDKKYEEAVRCYQKALTLDQTNFQILRDLSSMQIQLRDYSGYLNSREKLARFTRGAHQRTHLVGMAIANHLLGNHDAAIQALDLYADTFKPHPPPRDWDFSEMLLYRNQILHESGDLDTTLSHLDVIEPLVCDVRAVHEKRAQVLLEMGRNEQAMEAFARLVQSSPDCKSYVEGFIAASGERAEDVLEGLVMDYPKSNLMQVMYLNSLPAGAEAFEAAARDYLVANIVRGVPSLWANLSQLYDADPLGDKPSTLLRIVTSLLESPTDAMVDGREPYKMWIEYFLAQHHDRTGDYARAIEHAQRAIAEQPPKDTDSGNGDMAASASPVSVPELLLLQARIYKHAGNPGRARDLANAAREADLKDRYVNTKCVKYMLRADDLAAAQDTIKLFARPDMADPLRDLEEMQCQWFAYESALLHSRANQYGLALKRLQQIIAHFREFDDDQFDFHTYCLRKMTLRAYVDMLKWEDRSRAHPYFERAAAACIREYIRLYEAPKAAIKTLVTEAEEAVKASKKATAKKKKEMAQGKDPDKDKHGSSMPDPDPLGLEFVSEADPLAQAAKVVKLLEVHQPKKVQTHALAFDVAYRQERWVIAMRAVQKMVSVSALGTADPEMHARAMTLAHRVTKGDVDAAVGGIVVKGLHELLGDGSEPVPSSLDVMGMNRAFETNNASSLLAMAAVARVWIEVGQATDAKQVVDAMVAAETAWNGLTFKQAQQVWEMVGAVGFGGCEASAELAGRVEESARAWFAVE